MTGKPRKPVLAAARAGRLVFVAATPLIALHPGPAGANPPGGSFEVAQRKPDDAYRPSGEPGSVLRAPGQDGPGQSEIRRPPGSAAPDGVERGDLAPVMAADGSGLPFELWRGVDVAGFEKLISEIEIPPRSAALHDLWKRLITSNVTPPSGQSGNTRFTALRLDALYRSGLAAEASAEIARGPATGDATAGILAARNELAAANRTRACELAAAAGAPRGGVPARVRTEAILLNGYCAAASGDTAGAGLAADLAREEGQAQTPGLAALDALSIGAKPEVTIDGRIGLLDYRLLEVAGAPPPLNELDKAEPALLIALANDQASARDLRLAAGEAAARLNALPPDGLAALYSALGQKMEPDALLGAADVSAPARRAALFKAAEAERTAMKKTRLMRALLDDARRAGLALQVMRMLSRAASQVSAEPELVWFAESAAEIGLAAGQYDMARRWVSLSAPESAGGMGLAHWLALADIADPALANRGENLAALESLALRGRFTPDALHRLATVLDALQYLVPIPLWEAASRTPQPAEGHLPPTGVLSALQEAAKKKEFGHTVLLVMKSLGPSGAEGANLIALGDSIRALKRAGLEADARRLALEALLGAWPRTATN